MRTIVQILIAATLFAGPAQATEKKDDDSAKIICKTEDSADLGTRLGRRKTCMTLADWKIQEAAAQRTMRHIEDRSRRTDSRPATER